MHDMPIKIDDIEFQIRDRFLKAKRFIIADVDRFGISNSTEFAKAIDWRISNLSRAENSPTFCIPQRYLNRIIVVFGLDSDWLITGRGEMKFHPINVQVSMKKNFSTAENPVFIGKPVQTKNANNIVKKAHK